MYYEFHTIKERFDIKITTANQTHKGSFELNKNALFLIGISITSDREDILFYRGSQKIQVNEVELFPENFESKLLLSGLNVQPNQRVVDLGMFPVGNGRLEIWYKDTPHPQIGFVPFRVSYYAYSIIAERKV